MSPIIAKILISILVKYGGGILRIAIKELFKAYMKQRAALTAEQRKEWDREWVKDVQVGEGALPGTSGIVIEGAIDPKAHVKDKVGE